MHTRLQREALHLLSSRASSHYLQEPENWLSAGVSDGPHCSQHHELANEVSSWSSQRRVLPSSRKVSTIRSNQGLAKDGPWTQSTPRPTTTHTHTHTHTHSLCLWCVGCRCDWRRLTAEHLETSQGVALYPYSLLCTQNLTLGPCWSPLTHWGHSYGQLLGGEQPRPPARSLG